MTRRRWSDPFIAHAPMQRSRRLRVQCGCAFVAEVDIVRSAHFGALVLPLCAVLLCCCGLVRCCYGLRCTMLMCGTRYSLLLAAGCCCAAVATHLVAARGAINIENIEILNIARKNNAATNINTAN